MGQALKESDYFSNALYPSRQVLDIKAPESIENFFKLNDIDSIIHCAALARISECEKDPAEAIETNIVGTGNLAAAVRRCEIRRQKEIRFIYISTDGVYAGRTGNYREDSATMPYSIYGWTKLGGECVVRTVKNHCIVRASFFDKNNIIFRDAATDMYSSKVTADYLAKALFFLLNSEFTGAINVGSERLSDYERYKKYKPDIVSCNRADIAAGFSFPLYYDSSLNIEVWRNMKMDEN